MPKLSSLKPDPHNRRSHPAENLAMLRRSLSDVGAARSIVIDENDQVLAGNGVIEAAAESGISKLRIIEADGQTVIAVRRRGLSDDQKRKLAMYDNRTAELSTWNGEQLREDFAGGLDLVPFFSEVELAAVLKEKDSAAIQQLRIARPHDIVWLLVAVPLEHWPEHQATIEALQTAGIFSTVALRPSDAKQKNR